MANAIDTLYTKKFTDVLRLNAQQEMSYFRPGAVEQSCSGEHANVVDFVGKSTVAERTTRGEMKTIADKDHSRRWVEPHNYSTESDIVDSLDMLRTMVDPTGQYQASQLAAMGRKIDDDFIAALHGTAKTGKSGTTSTAWDTAQDVAAGGTNFTIAKVLAGMQLLQENEVILGSKSEDLFMALTPKQFTKFVAFDEVKNADYGNTFYDKNRYVVDNWLGINIIVTNRLVDASGSISTTASATREIPLWTKSAMVFGVWKDVYGTVTQSNDRKQEPQLITTYADYGVARVEEEKVIKIIVDETV